jgi:hypothetical protein
MARLLSRTTTALALGCLTIASVGCAATLPPTSPADALEGQQGALLAYALQTWSEAGLPEQDLPRPIVRLVPPADIEAECGRTGVGGCSRPGTIVLSSDASQTRLRVKVVHELGHLIRRDRGASGVAHLRCLDVPGDDVMCEGGALSPEPTSRDVRFVRGA